MSKVEVNQISSQCGSTLTIGQSGDTVTLAAGATQSGFGRTGTVDWDTTKKTTSFTTVSGTGYFVDTSGGAVTATLPATPSAGDIVGFNDYARTFATNNLTIARNGSNIQGAAIDATISTNGQSLMFVYVDGTQGWMPTEDQTTGNYGTLFVTATGGTITTCGNYKIHTFTGPGTFTVTCAGNAAGSNSVDYLVVAGGGGGGGGGISGAQGGGGGGGAGGYRESSGAASGCYSVSPLGSCVSALPVTAQGYPITVGAGGSNTSGGGVAGSGANSIFSTITSAGGGQGGTAFGQPPYQPSPGSHSNGGSGGAGGGGGIADNPSFGTPGAGNTPPVSPPQGQNGGQGFAPSPITTFSGAGAGGATAAGGSVTPTSNGGAGGNGATTSISASPTAYAGGGGGAGGGSGISGGTGGTGGGGNGSPGTPPIPAGGNGTANTGGGGGGTTQEPNTSGSGGSGIVIIRYKYQ